MNTPEGKPLCSTPPQRAIPLPAAMPINRQRAILVGSSKWVNGTTLRYAFFGDAQNPAWAAASEAWKESIREAFRSWHELPIGLSFEEVDDHGEAEVRIGFDQNDGSWSYVGRDILKAGQGERTMNIGWDPTTPYGGTTCRHEIGHTLGMPHEHQSPFSGIVWNEEAVYKYFSGPPNEWDKGMIQSNILEKLQPSQVEGSSWDPKSIMEYEFGPGLIVEPAEFQQGIEPPGTISELDEQWMKSWYPGGAPEPETLEPFDAAKLPSEPHGQADFGIKPPASRKYEIGTFGAADTVVVLFEKVAGKLRYVAGDDDSGEERNARIKSKLFQGRDYVLRVRVNWVGQAGQAAVMYW
ncbi:MAG: M12 family metallopeptidase [Solirubrobacterales bacterium]